MPQRLASLRSGISATHLARNESKPMTDSNRPPAFKIPSPKNAPLFLFFGKGDYVVARTPSEASCLWMDHFDDRCYAREFEQLDNGEYIEIYLDANDSACRIDTMSLAEIQYDRERGLKPTPEFWTAGQLVAHFGIGYLASTEE